MLSVLAQRAAFRLPALSGSLLLRSHATPIVLKPVVTRMFGSTSLLAFPKAATKVTTKTTKTTKKTAKKAPAKAATKTRKLAAKKKPAKKPVKKVVKKAVKPKAAKKPASALFCFPSYHVWLTFGLLIEVVILPEHKPPKAVPTSYALFFKQFHKQHITPGSTMQESQETAKRAGAAWRAMSEEQKRVGPSVSPVVAFLSTTRHSRSRSNIKQIISVIWNVAQSTSPTCRRTSERS